MENLKEVFINCWNLQQENIKLKNWKELHSGLILAKENIRLHEQNKKQKEVIDKAIELLGNYKHYSTPDEKQNSDNEDLVNNAFDILKEVIK